MRLLNSTTLELEEFFGSNIPSYAILSHRWEDQEVTFQDMREGRGVNMAGYAKIKGCCRQAKADGWNYAWIDTCCIDKSSSAELSEAINSMFGWYRDAQVCYTYMSDVGAGSETTFEQSKWFTRGWTLQELLAPEMIVFYDKLWNEIGTKARLQKAIKDATGITHLFNFHQASVAQRMSWAARRETTRTEDEAYCLIGLFDINMPLLYGEGSKAFLRLQLQILKGSDDESIFAWATDKSSDDTGLLATRLAHFRRSGDIFTSTGDGPGPYLMHKEHPYAMTNKGLRIEALIIVPSQSMKGPLDLDRVPMLLLCWRRIQGEWMRVAILVTKQKEDQFLRVASDGISTFSEDELAVSPLKRETCYFKQQTADSPERDYGLAFCGFGIEYALLSRYEVTMLGTRLDMRHASNGIVEIAPVLVGPSETWSLDFNLLSGSLESQSTHSFELLVRLKPSGMDIISSYQRPVKENITMDRLSQPLPDGTSVSAILRRDGQRESVNFYRIEVALHLDGALPWPELIDSDEGNSMVCTEMRSGVLKL